MKLKWEELDLGNGKKRYLVTTGEFIVLPTLKEGPTCSGPCGGFEASISEQYKNVCVTDMAFDSFELHEQAFKEFFAKLKLPIYFKPHELEEGKIKALEKMGAKLTEDTENITLWWNEEDKRVWKFEE